MYSFIKPDNTFLFGKYKGEKIITIIKRDAQYVHWCIENNIIELKNKELQDTYEIQYDIQRAYRRGYDEEDEAEMDFCMGLSGGAQGWY